MDMEFFDTPQPFLDAAGDLLAGDPVLGSVIASVSERTARELIGGLDSWSGVGAPFARWWVVVRDRSGTPVSAAMRTAPFEPHPTFSLPMSHDAARSLAAALHARGEFLGGANGALPGAEVLARTTAELCGGELVVDRGTRLWEATSVAVPPAPEGRLRPATEADADLVRSWFEAFHVEADEQAGRDPGPTRGSTTPSRACW